MFLHFETWKNTLQSTNGCLPCEYLGWHITHNHQDIIISRVQLICNSKYKGDAWKKVDFSRWNLRLHILLLLQHYGRVLTFCD